ncbi:glycosyltransferase family 4 protein [Neobacillus niacini]|uniref:glycosyltransferase family 4 protein n=1 Tax=Neobacillus niacini TaxID=86668 RepID=UPI0005EF7966|nr:glycosyltransferase family 4 protein [Neobacillus niacini]
MKDILLVTNYAQFPGETGNSRYTYLAEKLVQRGFAVEIIASTFYHKTKKQRTFSGTDLKGLVYKTTLIYEPGYSKNISLKRLYSNEVIANNIIKYLKARKKPDLIYCPFPPISIGRRVEKFAKKYNIPFVIDIQDLWPEAFRMVFNIPIISDLVFKPMELTANKIFKNADAIVAVSETYVNRGLSVNKSLNEGLSVFLGTDLKKFDSVENESNLIIKPKSEIWVGYIGTLGTSYDINVVSKAIKLLNDRGINNIKFIVIGDGPKREEFEECARNLNIRHEFTGMLSYEDMIKMLVLCDIAVNPIVKGGASSIINKVGDYAAAGLAVLNTQESNEYRNLVEQYNVGLNSPPGDILTLADNMLILYNNPNMRVQMGKNNRVIAEKYFDRSVTYLKIVDLISNMID